MTSGRQSETQYQYKGSITRGKPGKPRRRGGGHAPLILLLVLMLVATGGVGILALHYYTAETYMVLNGEEQMSVGLYGLFEDPGVIAKKGSRDVSDQVEVTSNVDTTTPGDYEINYRSGNFTVSRKVTVLDHMSPVLKLKGSKRVQMKLGDEYEDPGYSAKAEDGTKLTDRVKVSDSDFRRAGTHDITYSVTDDEGRTTRLTRRVNIEPNTEYGAVGLPICMYHYVYDDANPPADVNNRWKNYISKSDLIEEMNWLNQEGYYYPTWDEVRDYIDGKLLLPDKSIVLTFDDGEMATLEQLKPITDQTHVPVTSFLITVHKGEKKVRKFSSKYLHFESHTHDMHKAGGAAGFRGLMPVVDYQLGLADLRESIRICGSNKAIAYPYGDYNQQIHDLSQEAGFLCGVTTQYGKVYPGNDPYGLARVRMWQDQSLAHFINEVSPPGVHVPEPPG